MQPEAYREKNRAAWNQAAPIHRTHRKMGPRITVPPPSFNTPGKVAQGILSTTGIKERRARLCGNNGMIPMYFSLLARKWTDEN